MKKISLSHFELGSLVWISIAIDALIFALLGVFCAALLIISIVGTLLVAFILVKRGYLEIVPLKKNEVILFVTLSIFALVLSLFTTPTIFGGRDEGSFSSAAILLSQDHSLSHSDALVEEFFEVYGPGKALNFPGFSYSQNGDLSSQFLPGYISWTGTWYSLFGVGGLKFVNFIPFVTFLFSFFLVLKRFTRKEKFAFIGVGILASMLPFVVFYKFTLTEIFFASLLWLSLHFLLRYFEKKSFENFVILFIPLFLAPFVRIEALGIIFMLVLIIIAADFIHAKIPRYQLMLVILGLSVAISFFASSHFFVDSFKNLFELAMIAPSSADNTNSASLFPDDWQGLYILKMLFTYNILPLIIMGAAMMLLLIKKKRWYLLFPLFFLMPTFIYLIDANISLDHPWMLRRFLFSIIPLFLLYTMFLLNSVSFKFPKIVATTIIIFFVLNIIQTIPFVFTSQNKTLLKQAESITKSFKKNDLLFVSQQSSGSGWSLISEPLRNVNGMQAVYFFNPNDFDKIDLQKFNSIYLITSNDELSLYENLPKEKIGEYSFKNNIIVPSRDPLSSPGMNSYEVTGTVFQLSKE